MGRTLVLMTVLAAACTPDAPIEIRGGGASARFEGGIATLAQDVSLGLSAIGRTGAMRAVGEASVERRDRVELRRRDLPGVIEWWRSETRGLEHGITIAARPDGDGELVLRLAVAGAHARSIGDDAIALGDRATYSGLVVVDARGVRVPAHMRGERSAIDVRIDDARATYPLVVDPMVMIVEGVLQRAAPPMDMAAARHVAISADGTRALVGYATLAGASRDDSGLGVYSFVRNGTAWSFEATVDPMAQTAALSPDGLTAVVQSNYTLTRIYTLVSGNWVLSSFSPPMANVMSIVFSVDGRSFVLGGGWGSGPCTVYSLVGGTWTLQGSTPVNCGTVYGADRDATRIVSGNGNTGYVYARTGPGTWALEYMTLRPGVTSGAISADGSRALFGDAAGPVVYDRTGTTWNGTVGLWGGGGGPFPVAITPDGTRAFFAIPNNGANGIVHGFRLTATGATDTWSCNGVYPGQGSAIAISADGGRLIAGAPGQSTAGPDDAIVCVTSDALGTSCTTSAGCGSGFCVDGVCCNSGCGGGAANDCMACNSALTGGTNGECGALSPRVAPTVTCRAAAPGAMPGFSSCDVAEVCDSATTACPPNAFLSAVVCHVASGPCEQSVVCSGTSAACAPSFVAAGTTCRFASGPCDASETCSGSSGMCPQDILVAAGTTCRPATGMCDPADTCDGTTAGCDATFAPATTICRAAANACDEAEHCTGATPSCPDDLFAPPWTVCAPSGGGVCDAPDLCSGTSATCVPTFASGVVCRPAAGACDVAESCSGTSTSCPPDATEGAGTVCRSSSAACDPAESCDGTSTTCPPDVSTCTPQPDAGAHDAGTSSDGSIQQRDAATPDASVSPPTATSCACRAGARDQALLPWIVASAILCARKRKRKA